MSTPASSSRNSTTNEYASSSSANHSATAASALRRNNQSYDSNLGSSMNSYEINQQLATAEHINKSSANNNNNDHRRSSATNNNDNSSNKKNTGDAAIEFLILLTSPVSENGANMTLSQVASMLSVPTMVLTSGLTSLKSSRLLRRQMRKWILQITNRGSAASNINNSGSSSSGGSKSNTTTGVGAWDFNKFPRKLAFRVVTESNAADALEKIGTSSSSTSNEEDDDLDSITTSVFSLLDDDVRKHFELLSRSMGQNFSSILNAPPIDPQTEAAARQASAAANSWANWIVGSVHNHNHNQQHGQSNNNNNNSNNLSSSATAGLDYSTIAQLPAYLSNPNSTQLISASSSSSSTLLSSSAEQYLRQASRHAASIANQISNGMNNVAAAVSSNSTGADHHHHHHHPSSSISHRHSGSSASIRHQNTGSSNSDYQQQQQNNNNTNQQLFVQDYSCIDQYLKDIQLSWKLRRDILSSSSNSSSTGNSSTHNNNNKENQMLNVIDEVEQMLAEGKPLIPPSLPEMFYKYDEDQTNEKKENKKQTENNNDDEQQQTQQQQESPSATIPTFDMGAILKSAFPNPVVLGFRKKTPDEIENDAKNKNRKSNKNKHHHHQSDAHLAPDETDEVIVVNESLSIAKVEEDDCNSSTETVAALENCLDTAKAWLMCYVHRQSRQFHEASKTFDDLTQEAREALIVGDSAFDDVSTAGSSLTGSMVQLAQLQRRRQNLTATLEMLERMEKFRRKSISVLSSGENSSSSHSSGVRQHLHRHPNHQNNNQQDPIVTCKQLSKIHAYLVRHPEFNNNSTPNSNNSHNNSHQYIICFAPILKSLNSKRTLLRQQLPFKASSFWSLQYYSNSHNNKNKNKTTTQQQQQEDEDETYWKKSNSFLEASIELGCLSGCLTAYRERTVLDFATKILQKLLKFVMDHASTHTPYQQQQQQTSDQHCVNAYQEFIAVHQQKKVAPAQKQQQQQAGKNNNSTSSSSSTSNNAAPRLSGPAYRTAMARIVQLSSFIRSSPSPHQSFVAIVSEILEEALNVLVTGIEHAKLLYSKFLDSLSSFQALQQPQHQSLQAQITKHSQDLYTEHLCNLRDVCLLSVAATSESYPLVYTGDGDNNKKQQPQPQPQPQKQQSRFPTSVEFNIIQTMNGLLCLAGEKLVDAFQMEKYQLNVNNNNKSLIEQQHNNNITKKKLLEVEVHEQSNQLKSLGTGLVKNCFKNYHNRMFEELLTVMQKEDWSGVEKVPPKAQDQVDTLFAPITITTKNKMMSKNDKKNETNSSSSTFSNLVDHYKYDLCTDDADDDNADVGGSGKVAADVSDSNFNGSSSGIFVNSLDNNNNKRSFIVTQSLLTLVKILLEYKRYEDSFVLVVADKEDNEQQQAANSLPSSSLLSIAEIVASRVGILLKVFDGQCTALVLGGGAAECGTVQAISWSHLATASVDLKVIALIAQQWEKRIEKIFGIVEGNNSNRHSKYSTLLSDLTRVKGDVTSHRLNLLQKIISTLSENIEQSVLKNAPTAATIMMMSSSSTEGGQQQQQQTGQKAESSWLIQLLKKVAMLRRVTKTSYGENSEEEARLTVQALYTVALFVRKHFVTLAATATTTSSSSFNNNQAVVKQASQYLVPLLRANVRNFKFSAVGVLKFGNTALSSSWIDFTNQFSVDTAADDEKELETMLTINIKYGAANSNSSATNTPPTSTTPQVPSSPVASTLIHPTTKK